MHLPWKNRQEGHKDGAWTVELRRGWAHFHLAASNNQAKSLELAATKLRATANILSAKAKELREKNKKTKPKNNENSKH